MLLWKLSHVLTAELLVQICKLSITLAFSRWISGWPFKKIKGEKLHVILVSPVTLIVKGEVYDHLTHLFLSAQGNFLKELT